MSFERFVRIDIIYMKKVKDYIYLITHDYDVRAMFFVFNSLLIDLGFMLTYLIMFLCSPSQKNWYGELAIYYLFLIIGYGYIFYKYQKFKKLPQQEKIQEEKKLFLPLGIIMFFLALVVLTLTYILYYYEIDTSLPTSMIIVHGAYVVYVFVRVIVSLVLLIKNRRKKLDNHPLSFIAKHLSYISILMSFLLMTNAFKEINGASAYWSRIVVLRGEFFGIVILCSAINFVVKGFKARK